MCWKYVLKPRDIILADPEYEDQEEKKRPLLVISKPLFHQNSSFFVCLGITSNQERDPYLIPIGTSNTEMRLEERSQVMCKRIVSVPQRKIIKKLTRATPDFYTTIVNKVKFDILDLEIDS